MAENKKQREQMPVSQLMYESMPLPVEDWLHKWLDGKPTPYADNIDEDSYYNEVELMVAVLSDHMRTIGNDLPEAAKDFVQEYLYRMEESSDVHIWNSAEVLRAAWPLMMTNFYECGEWVAGDPPGRIIVKTALTRLCTRRELMEFYERSGIEDDYKGRNELAGSVSLDNPTDNQLALKASSILANPKTDEGTRRKLCDAINGLSMATRINVCTPALVERSLTIMFESIETRTRNTKQREKRRAYQDLRKLLKEMEG